jgi:hypothetical protein
MAFIFHNIWDVILPIDFHIFQRGWNHQPLYVPQKMDDSQGRSVCEVVYGIDMMNHIDPIRICGLLIIYIPFTKCPSEK